MLFVLKFEIMNFSLDLKPETEKALQERVMSDGIDVDVYLARLIEKDIEEQELMALIKEVRQEIYQEKLDAKKNPVKKLTRRAARRIRN